MLYKPKIKVITFDCYGTLINWDSGTYDFFRKILPLEDKNYILNLIKRWEDIQFQLIQAQYIPYEKIQQISFAKTLHEFNISKRFNLSQEFLRAIPKWSPFPDVYPVLSLLKNYFRLVLVSNSPPSILKNNAKSMNIRFNKIISAKLIQTYKPSPDVFRYVLKQLNVSTSEIIHVAAGYKYDVIPAKTLGIKTVWVNRKEIVRPEGILPDHEISKLTSLPYII